MPRRKGETAAQMREREATASRSATESHKQKREDPHAAWKARYTKETGKSAEGLANAAGYNKWLAKQRRMREQQKQLSDMGFEE